MIEPWTICVSSYLSIPKTLYIICPEIFVSIFSKCLILLNFTTILTQFNHLETRLDQDTVLFFFKDTVLKLLRQQKCA